MINEEREAFIQLREIMNAVRDGIITFNEEGEILLVNKEMEKMWGYQSDMLVGRPFTFLIPPPHKSLQLELFKRRIKNEKSQILPDELMMTGQRSNGDIFPIELHISDFQYNGKRIFTAVVRDIAERLQVEKDLRDSKLQLELRTRELEKTQEELHQLVNELKRSNSELEQFAYIASHDLQEPLRNVEGYISLLK
ncbi:MAG: PAS domain S-box protein, partial [Saprospiraceae bacterium]|nr:PAS domain S-box protein [Saprospiraceae bacterium]